MLAQRIGEDRKKENKRGQSLLTIHNVKALIGCTLFIDEFTCVCLVKNNGPSVVGLFSLYAIKVLREFRQLLAFPTLPFLTFLSPPRCITSRWDSQWKVCTTSRTASGIISRH